MKAKSGKCVYKENTTAHPLPEAPETKIDQSPGKNPLSKP
jgi:hypothetical protein